jgi:hypothetical protein
MGVISTAVKHLIAAGMTGEDLVRAIEEMESQQENAGREPMLNKRQERNKRYYQRLKASEKHLNKTIKTNSDGGALPPSPSPLDPPPQTPPPIIPQSSSAIPETKRASRLSTEWALPVKWGRWAVDQGYSEATVRLESDKFRDFWCSKSGKDATKVDWEATWRNWMRNSGAKPRTTGPPVSKPKSEFMQHQDDVQRELDRARGIYRDDQFTGDTLDLGSGDYRAFHQAGAVKA